MASVLTNPVIRRPAPSWTDPSIGNHAEAPLRSVALGVPLRGAAGLQLLSVLRPHSGSETDVPYRIRAAAILDEWHEAERAYDTAAGISERIAWREEMRHMDALYVGVVDAARASHSPLPPAFPPSEREPGDPG